MKKAYTSSNLTPDQHQNQHPSPAGHPVALYEIEKAINQHRKNGPKTATAKSEYKRLKAELTKLYNENKRFVTEFEKTNYEYLALMRSTNGFFKLFGHSALFYAHNIAPKLNLKANLQPDGDYTNKSAVGFVPIKDPVKIADALKTLNINQVKTKDQTGNYFLFKLPWAFTDEQITEMTEDYQYKVQKFNQVVLVDNIVPVLFLRLEELLNAIYNNVRGMHNPTERETFGNDMIRTSAEMSRTYLNLANGQLNKLSALTQIKKGLTFIKYQTKLIADLHLWTPKVVCRIAELIITVQDILDRELRNERSANPQKGAK